MRRSYRHDDEPPVESEQETNKEAVLGTFKDAGVNAKLTAADVAERTGVKNVHQYIRILAVAGDIVRIDRGVYALPSSRHKAISKRMNDNVIAEDIRADERRRIAAELSKAVQDAVPKEPMVYIQGFTDGANFIAERVLGLVLDVDVSAAS